MRRNRDLSDKKRVGPSVWHTTSRSFKAIEGSKDSFLTEGFTGVSPILFLDAAAGSTDNPLLPCEGPVLWPRAVKKTGNCHRGVVDAADCFVTR